MIVNGFSVLAAFFAALRVVGGVVVLGLGVRAMVRRRATPDGSDASLHLLGALTLVLLGVTVVSWPLLYLVLESYVPEWPGVMCIQGVTRIGTGSAGPAARLPGLLAGLQIGKPLLVFVAGAWLCMHLLRRAQRTGARTGRVLAALLIFGAAAAADGAAESAYLWTPKKENIPAAGCCTVRTEGAGSWRVAGPPAPLDGDAPEDHTRLTVSFFALGAVAVAALSMAKRRGASRGWLPMGVVAAAASLPVGLLFLRDVAAPAFLHAPSHHCAYCLVRGAPESMLGAGLFVLAVCGAGWAGLVGALGGRERPGSDALRARLLGFARFGFLAALLMAAGRLVA